MNSEGNFLTRFLDSKGRPRFQRQVKRRWVGTELKDGDLLLYGAARRCTKCKKVTAVYLLKGEHCPDCQKSISENWEAPAQSNNGCLCAQICDCRYPPPDNWNGEGGDWRVSKTCPIHNVKPCPNPTCPIHGKMSDFEFMISAGVD